MKRQHLFISTTILVLLTSNAQVTISGQIVAWGRNNYGQCNVPAGYFTAMSAYGYHSLALTPEPGTLLLLGLGCLPLIRKRK